MNGVVLKMRKAETGAGGGNAETVLEEVLTYKYGIARAWGYTFGHHQPINNTEK